jgi:transposase
LQYADIAAAIAGGLLLAWIADLLTGDRGYQVTQQLPGIGPVLAAVIIAETVDSKWLLEIEAIAAE